MQLTTQGRDTDSAHQCPSVGGLFQKAWAVLPGCCLLAGIAKHLGSALASFVSKRVKQNSSRARVERGSKHGLIPESQMPPGPEQLIKMMGGWQGEETGCHSAQLEHTCA